MIYSISPVSIFEELRYIIEILAAEYMLFIPSPIKKRKHFIPKIIISSLAICLFTGLFGFIPFLSQLFTDNLIEPFGSLFTSKIYQTWYLSLLFISMVNLHFLFETNWQAIISRSILAWCIQHIEYVLINEIIGIGFWNTTRFDHFAAYIIISIVSCACLYFIYYWLIRKYIKIKNIDNYRSKTSIITNIIILVVLVCFTFYCQSIFYHNNDGNYSFKATIYDVLICVIFIFSQLRSYRIKYLEIQKHREEQLFAERQKQYEQSKKNIEIVNQKIHDFKQEIIALKKMDEKEQDEALKETIKSIQIYDSSYHTGNDAFDTILTEKKLIAEKSEIMMTVIADGKLLEFINLMDIYVLFGNILDNAIEACNKLEDKDKKVISLNIKENAGFVYIEQNNYYVGEIKRVNGQFITSKEDAKHHGFGIKSIEHIVKKYNGVSTLNISDNIFSLRILLPIKQKQNVPN